MKIKNTFIISIFLPLFVVCQDSFVDVRCVHTCSVKKSRIKKKEFCYISFIKLHGVTYLVKQKRYYAHLLGPVFDVLAARVAQKLDKNIAHKVMLIPAFTPFPGKRSTAWPATLHTLAVGKSIDKKRTQYRKMGLKQALHGIDRSMISWMARHKQLVTIVALDTFLCNNDRHQANLFYDSTTDTFCAIDMDYLFAHSLAYLSSCSLSSLTHDELATFTEKEWLAVLELRNTLYCLVTLYQPKEIIALLYELVKEAGLDNTSLLWTPPIEESLKQASDMIIINYQEVRKFIFLLDSMIKKALTIKPYLRNYPEMQLFEKCITEM